MKISRAAVCAMCLSVLLLWLPSGSGAVPNCQGVGNDLWGQYRGGRLPTDAFIDKLQKAKQDCPQLAGSIDRMVNGIKAQRERVAEAVAIVKMAVEQLTQQPAGAGQEGNQ
jgi:hypothetical protein